MRRLAALCLALLAAPAARAEAPPKDQAEFCVLAAAAATDARSHTDAAARFNMLMGKGEAAARRAWIEEHGNEAEADI